MKISPIREPDAMLIFYKLWKDGIIAVCIRYERSSPTRDR